MVEFHYNISFYEENNRIDLRHCRGGLSAQVMHEFQSFLVLTVLRTNPIVSRVSDWRHVCYKNFTPSLPADHHENSRSG